MTDVSGFGGISGIPAPNLIGNVNAHQTRLYYVALGVSLAVYALLRYLVRTPFGLTLQGIRDDPVRMSSLGYNVVLHRIHRLRPRRVRRGGRRCPLRLVERARRPGVDRSRRDDRRARDRRRRRPLPDRGRLGRGAPVRRARELLAADRLHRTSLRHADRRDLPRDRARLSRPAWSASGSARSHWLRPGAAVFEGARIEGERVRWSSKAEPPCRPDPGCRNGIAR